MSRIDRENQRAAVGRRAGKPIKQTMNNGKRNESVSPDFDDFAPGAPTFVTPRLRLRMLQPGDEGFLAELASDPDVMRYIHRGPLSRNAAIKWAKAQVEAAPYHWHLHKWLVELREDQTKVGWVELSKFRGVFDPAEDRKSDDFNLGYEFDKAYWNQGIAPEAARPILAYAFEELQLDRVVAFPREDSVRSKRVLEKLGFRLHPALRYQDEGGHECQLFALSAEAWRS
jgi:RimJ/RimL family protein N-acetyltransferase